MPTLQSVCVYCGSSNGGAPAYRQQATALGRELANAGIRLVYGGGSVGLMGAVADAVLQNSGEVTGIIPQFLADREVMHKGVTDLVVTADMHERKKLMFEQADAFVALPGGIGTLEELVEMQTWGQLGQHQKPILLANFDGYWQHLIALIDHMKAEGFVPPNSAGDFIVAERVQDVIPQLKSAISTRPNDRQTYQGRDEIISKM